MAKFRIVPTIVAGTAKFMVERRAGFLLNFWMFETFADTYDDARTAIIHLGGPIIEMITVEQ